MLQGIHYVQINSFAHKGLTFNLPFCSYLNIWKFALVMLRKHCLLLAQWKRWSS